MTQINSIVGTTETMLVDLNLVPFIGIACILGCIVAIFIQRENLPEAISMIFEGAFRMKAAAGGVLGYTLAQAIRFGVARGVFTNEAGLGSAPIAHTAADVDHSAKQGLWGCFEFLTNGKGGRIYQGIYCCIVVIAAIMQLNLVWDIADTLNGLMAIPNLIVLIGLSPVVLTLTKDYFARSHR